MSTLRSRFLPAGAASSVLLAAVAGFIALIGAAMTAYPGGTAWDAATRGHSFWLNYLCDLERRVALDGEPNATGSALAQAALLILALGLVLFWRLLPRLFPAQVRLGLMVRSLGSVALVGTVAVALLPSDRFASIHPVCLVVAGVPSLVAALLAVVGLLRKERALRAVAAVGAAALLVSGADFALYVWEIAGGGPSLRAEAVLERVSLILVLAWMCTVAHRLEWLSSKERPPPAPSPVPASAPPSASRRPA
jgi:hypothetical protein